MIAPGPSSALCTCRPVDYACNLGLPDTQKSSPASGLLLVFSFQFTASIKFLISISGREIQSFESSLYYFSLTNPSSDDDERERSNEVCR